MNIFYFFKELDTPMYQWQRTNLIDELIRNGHKVKTFNPLDYQSIEEANAITVPSIKKWGKCDLFLTCDDQDTIFKETVEEINKMGIPTCLICWDNLELPFKQKKIAPAFDIVWITSVETQYLFEQWGCKNIIFQTYAANPYTYTAENIDKQLHSVGFIGSPYGSRTNKLNDLLENGVNCSIYSNSLFNKGYNTSIGGKKKINLSFDEWNVWYHSNNAPYERWSIAPPRLEDIYNFEDALLVGSMLITFLRHCDRIKIACLAQLVNVIAPIFTQTGGGIFAQTIFYPFEHLSNFGRGVALNPIISSPKYDCKAYTDVPFLESIATFDEENEEMTVFCVNKSMNESMTLDVNLLDFDGYKPFEFISMDGYDKNDVNSFENPFVKPHNNPLPELDDKTLTAQIKPFSWNVIRLKKCDFI